MQLVKFKKIIILSLLLVTGYWLLVTFTHASRLDDLQKQIDEKNAQMEQIEKEIAEYQAQVDKIGGEKTTLKNEITRLEANAKKLNSDISLTKKKIEATNFNIEKLELEIDDKGSQIVNRKDVLAESIRNINEEESLSLVEITLSKDKLSDFFGDLERMEGLQKGIGANLVELKDLKSNLEDEKTAKEKEKKNMEQLKSRLVDQKVLVDSNKMTKNQLLSKTKNLEQNYKKILADRIAKQKALEQELLDIEEQIKVEIDPKSLPSSGSGVLKWPLDGKIFITQYFGNTSFATANPQVYNGGGHNGIDFRASLGAPIKAAQAGVIKGVGDTDRNCNGVSYGKWVLIEHPNNLTTLYAHLSLIKVSAGQNVETGEIIGYNGETGYTTGPHLHFTVFATPGVKISQIRSKICGTLMTLPVAARNSYLNPLSYL